MGVGEDFKTFCNSLRVGSAQRSNIAYRYQQLTRRLNKDFWDFDSETAFSFYIGSYGRGTAINGFSDLDMAFELPSHYFEKYNNYQTNGQSALLQSVKSSIQVTYPSTYVGGDGQVVVVEFSDGMKFEVLPVFESNEGGFIYPDSNYGGSWKKTDPKPEIKAMTELDSRCNGNLKWLCRMMREWKLYWDVPIKGILIDSLAYDFISNWEYKENSFIYYDWMTRDFFEFLQAESGKSYWFAPGSYDLIYNSGDFGYKAKRGYNLSIEAISYASDGHEYSSRKKWREVYGTIYPS